MTPLEASRALPPGRPRLVRAEPVQRTKGKAEVWRLADERDRHRLIAKRCTLPEAAAEELVYRGILPRLGLPADGFTGRVDTGDGRTAWLFLTEVVGAPYVAEDPVHRDLAAAWLSGLHAAARSTRAIEGLPDVGPVRYAGMLTELVRTLPVAAHNPELDAAGTSVLGDAGRCCRELLDLWPSVQRQLAPLPHTLVHGSFSRRNMLVAASPDGPRLAVFDWAAAGWGVPARDLVKLVSPTIAGTAAVYWRRFPAIATGERRLLITIGRVFRAIEHLTWAAPRLSYPSVAEPMSRAAAHTAELVTARDLLRRLL